MGTADFPTTGHCRKRIDLSPSGTEHVQLLAQSGEAQAMTLEEFDQLFDRFEVSAFHLETHQTYEGG